jgi:hypothetical protein
MAWVYFTSTAGLDRYTGLEKSSWRYGAISAVGISFSLTVDVDMCTWDSKRVRVIVTLSADQVSCFRTVSFDICVKNLQSA